MVALGVAIIALLSSCEKEPMAQPKQTKAPEYITFKSIGLNNDVAKQIHIRCGGYLLDTVIWGNFTHQVLVTQRNMHSHMEVKTLQPISDALSIEGQGQLIRKASSCDWFFYSIDYTFIY